MIYQESNICIITKIRKKLKETVLVNNPIVDVLK